MSYANIYTAANDATFQGRCMVALWKVAQDIIYEAPATPNHWTRFAWATDILRDKARITPRQVAMQILRNTTIAADPLNALVATDQAILFQVGQVLDDFISIG